MDAYRRTKNLVLSRAYARDILEAIDPGVGGTGLPILNLAEVILFKGPFVPNPDMVIGDLTPAALSTGAERVLNAIGDPINLPNNRLGMAQNVEWIAGAAPTEETIAGYAITTGDGLTLLAAERFDNAEQIAIGAQGDYVSIDVIVAVISMVQTTGLT